MRKKRDNAFGPSGGEQLKRYIGDCITPEVLVPLRVEDSEYPQRSFVPQPPSLWEGLLAWLRYYIIQWRWDIERWLARWIRIHGTRN